jgi:hypothetical protein
MGKTVDEYVVGLSYDLDDKNAKKYIDTQKQIDEQNKKVEDSAKKQSQTVFELGNSFRLLSRALSDIKSGDILGAFSDSFRGFQSTQNLLNTLTQVGKKPQKGEENQKERTAQKQPQEQSSEPAAEKPTEPKKPQEPTVPKSTVPKDSSQQKPREPSVPIKEVIETVSWPEKNKPPDKKSNADVINTADDVKGTDNLTKSIQSMGNSLALTNNQAVGLKTTLQSVFEGGSSDAAVGGAEAIGTAAIGSAAAATGIGAAIAAVVVLAYEAADAIYQMADSLSTANTDVETMSAKLWITNSAAWQLNNTLSAMGKSTSDLNDIALNPTLREQFETLQNYQQTLLKLPSDFQSVNEQWAESVQTPMDEMKLTLQYQQELLEYNIEKDLLPIAKELEPELALIVVDLQIIFETLTDIINFAASGFKNSPYMIIINGLNKILGLGSASSSSANSSSNSKSSTSSPSSATQSSLSGYDYSWANAMPSTSSVTQSSTSTTTNRSTSNISKPTVNVYPQNGDPQTIGQAAAQGVTEAQSNLFMMNNLQGVER